MDGGLIALCKDDLMCCLPLNASLGSGTSGCQRIKIGK